MDNGPYQPNGYMPMHSATAHQPGQFPPYQPYSSQQAHAQHQQAQSQSQSQQPQQQQHQHQQQQPHQAQHQHQSQLQHPQQQQQQQHQQHSQHQPAQDATRENPTLPPLHTQGGSFGQLPSLYNANANNTGSHPHTPTTHTPTTSSMPAGSNLSAFSHHSSPATTGSMLPPSSSFASYPSLQATMPPSSTATATAPPLGQSQAQNRLPDLRPIMPQQNGGYSNSMSPLPAFGASSLVAGQPYMASQETEPTHVVGSQGRRGILPSAPGRAQAPPAGTAAASTKSMIPAKDADGKFPCPHCNKTYLHAKHLKRHLLRHTGDRPYMCHLCKDTFSRSDILKRHFQKCSIRRGNPTGANHLAHQRRNTNRGSISSTEPIGLAGIPEVAGAPYTNGGVMSGVNSTSPTVNGEHSYASSVASVSGRSSRANSLIHPLSTDHRHSLTGISIPTLSSNAPNGEHGPPAHPFGNYSFGMRPHSVSNPMPPSFGLGTYASHMANNGANYPSYSVKTEEQNPNGYTHQPPSIPENRPQPSGGDWASMFNANGHDGFMTATHQGAPQPVKPEQHNIDGQGYSSANDHPNENLFSGLYSHPSAFGEDSGAHHLSGFPNWNVDLMQDHPLQRKADDLLTYVLSNRTSSSDDACDEMRRCLTVENMKHFIEQFTSFQGHWPVVHMPSFDLMRANSGLLLTIICIGAVYSERRDVYQVRQMMDLTKDAVRNASRVYRVALGLSHECNVPLGAKYSDIEEIQALYMLSTLFVWHGNQSQRAIARQEFSTVVAIARRMGLTRLAGPQHPAFSILHQSGVSHDKVATAWNWSTWIAQEQRDRVLYGLLLLDFALVIYFNCPPQFDSVEVSIPLPADDAAWDAKSDVECRNALGLNGLAAQASNLHGSRQPQQLELSSALRSLMDLNYASAPWSTNVYSKFILVHALIVNICKVQRSSVQKNMSAFPGTLSPPDSGTSTPLGHNHNVAASPDGSPLQLPQVQAVLKALNLAMNKWKQMWDRDIEHQYAPGTDSKRFGFSRDGIHFFYLGSSFMRSNRPSDWTAPPDIRFKQVMTLLKKIKGFVVNDNYQGGLDTGSVGDIDDTYGIGDVTLDMKLLFRKLGSRT